MCNLPRDFTSFLSLFVIYSKKKGGHVWWRHGIQSVTSRSGQLTQKIIFCPSRPVVTDVIPFTTVITELKLRALPTTCWYHCGEKQRVYRLILRLFSSPQRPNTPLIQNVDPNLTDTVTYLIFLMWKKKTLIFDPSVNVLCKKNESFHVD